MQPRAFKKAIFCYVKVTIDALNFDRQIGGRFKVYAAILPIGLVSNRSLLKEPIGQSDFGEASDSMPLLMGSSVRTLAETSSSCLGKKTESFTQIINYQ